MVRSRPRYDDAVMAPTRGERNTSWPVETGGPASPPAVVCALNGSPPGRAAAAYAAALARALDWRLGLVASGLKRLDLPMLAEAVVDEGAGIVVQPTERRGSAAAAGELAVLAGVPVVVVPSGGYDQRFDGPIMVAPEPRGLSGVATRVALALATGLKVVDAHGPKTTSDVLDEADARGARLVVLGAGDAWSVPNRRLSVPVMLVSSADEVR